MPVLRQTAVTELRLARNDLTSLPDAISALVNLRILDVAENRLTTLPGSIGALYKLEELDASEVSGALVFALRSVRFTICARVMPALQLPRARRKSAPAACCRRSTPPCAVFRCPPRCSPRCRTKSPSCHPKWALSAFSDASSCTRTA